MSTQLDIEQLYEQQIKALPRAARLRLLARIADDLAEADAEDEQQLNLLDLEGNGGSSFMEITHCPWCGTALPSSLRDQWFNKLEKLGLEPDSEALPSALTTEEWWQNPDN